MKTLTLCLLTSVFLFSCQDEASLDNAKENFGKKNTTSNRGILNASNQDNNGNPTNATIDGGVGILLVTSVAYGAKGIIGNQKPQAD